MKKIILVLSIFVSISAHSQIKDVRFSVYIKTDPYATYKDGFNIGAGINYQSNIFYIEAQTFVFPDLNDYTYFDIGGGIGLNWHSKFRNWRIYAGGNAAIITRGSFGGYASLGYECGVDYYFYGENKGFFIGINASRVNRTDSKLWSNDSYFTVNNGLFKLGFSF